MKKKIVDLLGRAIKEEESEKILSYVTVENGKYVSKKKKLSKECQEIEIEEKWIESRLPLSLTSASTNNVGTEKIIPNDLSLKDAKEWVFFSILFGILVREAIPQGPVMIWVEEDSDRIKVCGVCQVKDIPKSLAQKALAGNGGYSKIEF